MKPKRTVNKELLKRFTTLPCAVSHKCFGRVAGHHIKTRGSGGPDTEENLIPLCALAHTIGRFSIHQIGPKEFLKLHEGFIDSVAKTKIMAYLEWRGK